MSDLKNSLQSPSSNCWSWQDKAMLPCTNGVPLSDRGFRYGQHLFETIAIRNGHALFVEEHCQRLAQAAEKFHFAFDATWHQGLRDFFKNTHLNDGILRLFLTAGDGAMGAPMKGTRLFAFWEETIFPSSEELEQGIALISLEHPIGNTYWGVKNGNYWEHVCALKDAHRASAQEGLVFDADGFLISAAMANVLVWFEDPKNMSPQSTAAAKSFVAPVLEASSINYTLSFCAPSTSCSSSAAATLKTGSNDTTKTFLVTPSCARGARAGVVRAWARENISECIERDITRADLENARAMAVTNSRLGVMPVASLDGRKLPNFELSLKFAYEYLKN